MSIQIGVPPFYIYAGGVFIWLAFMIQLVLGGGTGRLGRALVDVRSVFVTCNPSPIKFNLCVDGKERHAR